MFCLVLGLMMMFGGTVFFLLVFLDVMLFAHMQPQPIAKFLFDPPRKMINIGGAYALVSIGISLAVAIRYARRRRETPTR